MKIDSDTSTRLTLLRYPLIVGIIFIHAYGVQFNFKAGSLGDVNQFGLALMVQSLFSQVFGRVAVPLFFLMSGFLLFCKWDDSSSGYKRALKSRTKTLLVPFLLWNVITLCIMAFAQNTPPFSVVFSGNVKGVADYGAFDYLNALFGITKSPIAYQFWFIRDLMVLVIFSPAILLLSRLSWKLTLLTLFTLWFLHYEILFTPSAEAQLFFFLGLLWARGVWNPTLFDKKGTLLVVLYLVWAVIDTFTKDHSLSWQIHRFGILIGLLAVWYIAGLLLKNERASAALKWLSAFSFFTFAAHEPLLTGLKKGFFKFLEPQSNTEVIVIYLAAPLIALAATLVAAVVLSKLAPRAYSVVSGGR